MKRLFIPFVSAVLFLLTACSVVSLGDSNNPVDVSYALEKMDSFYGKDTYIKCYPVAYQIIYSINGIKSVEVFFSDSASDFCGELDSAETVKDNWLNATIHEDDALWKAVEEVFLNGKEAKEYILVFRGMKDSTFGYYYDFKELYS